MMITNTVVVKLYVIQSKLLRHDTNCECTELVEHMTSGYMYWICTSVSVGSVVGLQLSD